MFWFIILPLVIGVGSFLLLMFDGLDGPGEAIATGVLSGIFFGGLAALMLNFIIGLSTKTVPDHKDSTNLVSLNMGSQTYGHFAGAFFVASGFINERLTYIFYTNNNGVYSVHQVAAGSVTIRQVNEPPHIDCTYYNEVSNVTDKHWDIFPMNDFDHKKCELTIPPGSIKQVFSPNPK